MSSTAERDPMLEIAHSGATAITAHQNHPNLAVQAFMAALMMDGPQLAFGKDELAQNVPDKSQPAISSGISFT